jgi:hypothetical protein
MSGHGGIYGYSTPDSEMIANSASQLSNPAAAATRVSLTLLECKACERHSVLVSVFKSAFWGGNVSRNYQFLDSLRGFGGFTHPILERFL